MDPFFCCAIFLYPLSLPKPTTKSDHIRDGRIKKGRNFLDIGISDVHQDLPGFLRDLLNKNDILVRSACAIVDDDNDNRDLTAISGSRTVGRPAHSVHHQTISGVMAGGPHKAEPLADSVRNEGGTLYIVMSGASASLCSFQLQVKPLL